MTRLIEGGGDLLGAVAEDLVDLEGAGAEILRDLVGAVAQKLVDRGDAAVERLADLLGLRGEGVGDGVGPRRDRLADLVHAGLKGSGHVASAFRHDTGHLAGAHHEGFVESARAGAENAVDALDDGVEIDRDFRGATRGMLLEGGKLRLDGGGRLPGALGEGLGYRAALHGDQAVHLLEAAGDRLGQAAHVAGNAVGDIAAAGGDILQGGEAGAEGFFHLAGPAVDGGRQGLGRAVEHLVHARALAGDRQHDVLGGAGQTGLRIVRVTGEGVREFLAAGFEGGAEVLDMAAHERREALAGLGKARLEGMALDGDGFADAPACRFEAGGEILDAGADGLVGHADRTLQLLAHFAAALADLAGDVGGRRRQALAEFVAAQNDFVDDASAGGGKLLAQSGAAGRQLVEESAGCEGEFLAQAAAACGEFLNQCRACGGKGLAHLRAAGDDLLAHGGACLCDLVAHLGGAGGDVVGDYAAGGGELLGDLSSALGEAVLQGAGRLLEGLAHVVALLGEGVDHAAAGLGQGPRDLACAVLQVAGQEVAGALEGAGDVLRLALERARDGRADFGDAVLDLVAGACEALHQLDAAARHLLDDALAGAAKRLRDVVALLFERGGDLVAGAADGRGDALAGAVEILDQVLVNAGDGATHALRIGDDGLTLCHQLVDERADADLVVGIGTLQRRDLAAHESFELAGAGKRTLDAVADGCDFTAHRLRDGQDRVGGKILGLRESHGDFADCAGHQLHLLRADGQHGGDEEQEEGGDEPDGAERQLRDREGGQQLFGRGDALHVDQRPDAAEPEQGGEGGHPVSTTGRAKLECLEHHADILAVVVGDGVPVGRDEAGAVHLVEPGIVVVGLRGERVGAQTEGPLGEIVVVDIRQLGLFEGGLAARPLGRVDHECLVEVERLLDSRKGRLRRVFHLLVLGRHDPPS